MSSVQTPDWVRDAVFYQIFPDRFARSDRVPKASNLQPWGAPPTGHAYQGGDLLGVVERLDYLADLGINAIYFNPIFRSGSNHRYHTHDYYQVDPMLGGNAALRELLDAAHARGIRVVLDGVFNHASRGLLSVPRHPGERPRLGLSGLVPCRGVAAASLRRRQGQLRRVVGQPGAAQVQHRHPGRAAFPLGCGALLDRLRRSTAGGWMCPRRSTTTSSGASSGAWSRRPTPTPTSWAKSGARPSGGSRAISTMGL